LQFFSAEDLIRYKRILPTLHKVIGPFPIQNAKKILALLQSGTLNIVAIGTEGRIRAGDENKGLRISWKKGHSVQHDFEIDALGQSGEMEYCPSPLYRCLQQSGFVEDVYVLFREQIHGRKLFQQTHGKGRIMNMNGKFYYKAPG